MESISLYSEVVIGHSDIRVRAVLWSRGVKCQSEEWTQQPGDLCHPSLHPPSILYLTSTHAFSFLNFRFPAYTYFFFSRSLIKEWGVSLHMQGWCKHMQSYTCPWGLHPSGLEVVKKSVTWLLLHFPKHNTQSLEATLMASLKNRACAQICA